MMWLSEIGSRYASLREFVRWKTLPILRPSFGGIPPNWWRSLKRLPFRRGGFQDGFPQSALRCRAMLFARRLVSNALLLAYGHCPLTFRSVDANDYRAALLLFYKQNNLSAFKRIFVEQAEFAVHEYF